MIKEFIQECKRVLKVTRKPNKKELMNTIKITGLGILFIGFIGFIIYLITQLVQRMG
ncbi:MAG: protein translocase SEC61 complex subunit gamma [Candidatus Woesearchaeota archaeon]